MEAGADVSSCILGCRDQSSHSFVTLTDDR